MIHRRRQRGNFLVVAALAVAAAGVFSVSLGILQSGDWERRREAQTDAYLREAKRALQNYFLIENVRLGGVDIPQGINKKATTTRALQFPCPDNIGDDNLDGAQDTTCGVGVTVTVGVVDINVTKDALASGSRFGRLPWRSEVVGSTAQHIPSPDLPHLRDGFNARFWYALAYNVAPKKNTSKALNLHALAAKKDGWLLVRDLAAAPMRGNPAVRDLADAPVVDRVMAVVLAPHKPLGARPRFDENVLATMSLITTTVSGGITTTINLTVAATDAENYFEELVFTTSSEFVRFAAGSVTMLAAGATITLSNFDGDGEFVYAPLRTTATLTVLNPDGSVLTISESVMDDRIGYLTLDEMLNQEGDFLPRFERFLGANREIQNLPIADSPLSQIAESLAAFRAAFGFYPIPAAMGDLNNLSRGCGLNELAQDAAVALSVNTELINLRPLAIAASGTGEITITLTAAAPMRAVNEVVVAGDVAIISIGQTLTLSSPTLAPGARLALPANVTVTLAATTSGTILPAGATVTITTMLSPHSAVTANISAAVYATVDTKSLGNGRTLTLTMVTGYPQLAAQTVAHGLMPEHNIRSMTVGSQSSNRVFAAGARGGFLSAAELSLSDGTTITIAPRDKIIFPVDTTIKISQGKISAVDADDGISGAEIRAYLDDAVFPAGVSVEQAAATIDLSGARPLLDTFLRRDLAILVTNADISLSAGFIPAPAVIYPWREQEGALPINRDNLNRWPPCWDAREFSPAVQRMVENFPLYYAVAGDCLPGGGCGGGLTVAIAPRTTFALPSPYTITAAATFPPPFVLITDPLNIPAANNPEEKLEVDGTVYRHTRNSGAVTTLSLGVTIYIPRDTVVSLHSPLSAIATLARAITVTAGESAVLPAQTPLASGAALRIENAEALLIFSPAPLHREVSCVDGGGDTVTFFQTRGAAGEKCDDLAEMDLYLEEEENRNLDSVFMMERFLPRPMLGVTTTVDGGGVTTTIVGEWREPVNDFFIVFGGALGAP